MNETVAGYPGQQPARRWSRKSSAIVVALLVIGLLVALHVKKVGILVDTNNAPEMNGGDYRWLKECKYLYAVGLKDIDLSDQPADFATVDGQQCPRWMPKR